MMNLLRPATQLTAMLLIVMAANSQAANDAPLADAHAGDWCYTQTMYEKKLALDHAAVAPEACALNGPCDAAGMRDSYITSAEAPIRYLRIYFNVMRNDDGSNAAASPSDVQTQVERLNSHFLPFKIQFEYDVRFINSTFYRVIRDEWKFDAMKNTYAVDPADQLNVFVCSVNIDGSVYSYGTFPWSSDALGATGGIVMNRTQFYPYDSGTLTHEVGHNIGLWHTFHGVSEVTQCGPCYEAVGAFDRDATGDLCSDTDPTPLNYACSGPGGVDPCTGFNWGLTDPQNYMSYAPSYCYSEFSPQQTGRMHCWIEAELLSWEITLEIDGSPVFGSLPHTVDFTGSTAREALSWDWDFGDGGASAEQNPQHIYTEPGYYTVAATINTPQGLFSTNAPGLISIPDDTIRMSDVEITSSQFTVDIMVHNFVPLKEMTIPIYYDGQFDLDYTGISAVGLRAEHFPMVTTLTSSNTSKRATIWLSANVNGPFLDPGSGAIARLSFTASDGVGFDTNLVRVQDYLTRQLNFVTHAGAYLPTAEAGAVYFGCCFGTVGDANYDAGTDATIGDVSALVDHLFITRAPLECYLEADINLSALAAPTADDISIGDVSVLVDHLFITRTPLPDCP